MIAPPPLSLDAHALFLDFDGTLVGFVDDPAAVRVEEAVVARLIALKDELAGALAIVSGRRIADLDAFLAPLAFVAAGVHGLERRRSPSGETVVLAGSEALDDVRRILERSLPSGAGTYTNDLTVEDKGTALVLHYRTAPEREEFAKMLMRDATRGRGDLVVMEGVNVVEVHPAGMDKGQAVAALMADLPFKGRTPVYAGDDVTDEFALVHVRTAGGISIKVGDAPSAAEFRLADVAALHRWLGVEPEHHRPLEKEPE